MSDTIAAGSKKTIKHTCQDCKRTVYVITLDEGVRVYVDPELITVVPYEGSPRKITARRSHSELCLTYQMQAERARAKLHLARGRRK